MTRKTRGDQIARPEVGATRHVRSWLADAPSDHHPADIWRVEIGQLVADDRWYVYLHQTGWTSGGCRAYDTADQVEAVAQQIMDSMSATDPRRKWVTRLHRLAGAGRAGVTGGEVAV